MRWRRKTEKTRLPQRLVNEKQTHLSLSSDSQAALFMSFQDLPERSIIVHSGYFKIIKDFHGQRNVLLKSTVNSFCRQKSHQRQFSEL